MKRFPIVFAAMFILIVCPVFVGAASFTFTFDGPSIHSSGTLDATDNGNGSFTAIDGSGMTNGVAMTLFPNPLGTSRSISPANSFYYDNQLFPGVAPFLSANGLLFTALESPASHAVAAIEVDFLSAGSQVMYWENYPRNSYNNQYGTFTLTAIPTSIPEPASMLLLGIGLIGLTGARRFKSKTNKERGWQ